jgi:hypothetical protein
LGRLRGIVWLGDSTDFQVKGKHSVHKDMLKWSHKLHSPGMHWVTVMNVKGQPTAYDGDILISSASVLDAISTNTTKAGRPRIVDGKKIPVTLTPEEEEWNRKISLVRGKIEAPYGCVKRVFLSLDMPFYENEKQHDCVVKAAAVCHRLMNRKE